MSERLSQQKNWPLICFFGVAWLLGVTIGMYIVLVHANTSGVAATPPINLPANSEIHSDQKQPLLIMFGHPQCPCTRASIAELAVLMAQCQGRLRAQVLFIQPEGFSDQMVHSDLWQSAAAIPGVTVAVDKDGQAAKKFQAQTSGQVLLYDAQGRLLFTGGITGSRAHQGDNAGRSAIAELVTSGTSSVHNTPVFGCALSEHQATKDEPISSADSMKGGHQ